MATQGTDIDKIAGTSDLAVVETCNNLTIFTLDKSTLLYSSIMGINKDDHLTSNEYAWLGSIFSPGYLFANFPCALISQNVLLSK